MDSWIVQKDGATKTYSDKKLRKKLRSGDLSGVELARRDGASGWTPLHELPIFSEEVAFTGDARSAAWTRQASGFGWHLAVFLGVMWFLGFPWWGIFWGIGVAGHLWGSRTALLGLAQGAQAQAQLPQPTASAAPVAEDDFSAALEKALGALEQDGESVSAIRADAEALHARRLAFEAAISDIDIGALEAELAQRRAAVDAAERAADIESFSREVVALEGRLESAHEAVAARDRLAAQERELLHQLEGIRLARLRASLDEEAPVDAAAQIGEIRERIAAEAEVDARLAAARRAARAQRS